MSTPKEGCVKPAAGPLGSPETSPETATEKTEEAPAMLAKVGHPAPDFEVTAYMPATKNFAP